MNPSEGIRNSARRLQRLACSALAAAGLVVLASGRLAPAAIPEPPPGASRFTSDNRARFSFLM
jgi:hypothetical protein